MKGVKVVCTVGTISKDKPYKEIVFQNHGTNKDAVIIEINGETYMVNAGNVITAVKKCTGVE